MIWRLNFFTHMDIRNFLGGDLLLINGLSQRQRQTYFMHYRSFNNNQWGNVLNLRHWFWTKFENMKTIKRSRVCIKLHYIFGHFCLSKQMLCCFSNFLVTHRKLLSVELELEITTLETFYRAFFLNFLCYF